MLKNIYEILCKSVGYRPSAMINTSKIGFSLKESLKETNMIVQGVDLMDLYNDLQQKIKELNISIKKLRETGTEYAEAEKEYKITLRQEAFELRAEKGMPVTLMQQVVYGVPDVAEKRFVRDVKEAVYKANQEAINVFKLQIRIIESQLQREYGNINNQQ